MGIRNSVMLGESWVHQPCKSSANDLNRVGLPDRRECGV